MVRGPRSRLRYTQLGWFTKMCHYLVKKGTVIYFDDYSHEPTALHRAKQDAYQPRRKKTTVSTMIVQISLERRQSQCFLHMKNESGGNPCPLSHHQSSLSPDTIALRPSWSFSLDQFIFDYIFLWNYTVPSFHELYLFFSLHYYCILHMYYKLSPQTLMAS